MPQLSVPDPDGRVVGAAQYLLRECKWQVNFGGVGCVTSQDMQEPEAVQAAVHAQRRVVGPRDQPPRVDVDAGRIFFVPKQRAQTAERRARPDFDGSVYRVGDEVSVVRCYDGADAGGVSDEVLWLEPARVVSWRTLLGSVQHERRDFGCAGGA